MIRTGLALALTAGAATADPAADRARAACTGDALRLCAHAIGAVPDVGRIAACLQANATKLSAGCHAALAAIKK